MSIALQRATAATFHSFWLVVITIREMGNGVAFNGQRKFWDASKSQALSERATYPCSTGRIDLLGSWTKCLTASVDRFHRGLILIWLQFSTPLVLGPLLNPPSCSCSWWNLERIWKCYNLFLFFLNLKSRIFFITLIEIFIFCPKIQLWFPEKIVDFCKRVVFCWQEIAFVFMKAWLRKVE